MNGPDHRQRHQLHQDQRRLAFELDRLGGRIVEHRNWPPSAEQEIALLGHWQLSRQAPPSATTSIANLDEAIRDLSLRLVLMTRLWLALERSEPVAAPELEDPTT